MSSLEWVETPHTSYNKPAVITMYWELWAVGEDRTAWYNLPVAYIYRRGKRLYELEITDNADIADDQKRQYKTLKEAKAMGIVIVQMEK